MAQKHDIQLFENQILWFNGEKWLVKETFKSNEEAEKVFNEIEKTVIQDVLKETYANKVD